MSVNRYQPHVLVLPEDDANRQLANGFVLDLDAAVLTRIQVLEEVGGWHEVLNHLQSDHIADMNRYTNRFIVLLIDFDRNSGRLDDARNEFLSPFEIESLFWAPGANQKISKKRVSAYTRQ